MKGLKFWYLFVAIASVALTNKFTDHSFLSSVQYGSQSVSWKQSSIKTPVVSRLLNSMDTFNLNFA